MDFFGNSATPKSSKDNTKCSNEKSRKRRRRKSKSEVEGGVENIDKISEKENATKKKKRKKKSSVQGNFDEILLLLFCLTSSFQWSKTVIYEPRILYVRLWNGIKFKPSEESVCFLFYLKGQKSTKI